MRQYPKISIIIPVYNGEKYLRQAIDSAISQTYSNKEIIVINDGSIDNTDKIAKSYGNKIKYIAKENGGVSTALNLGIELMTGEYFSWLSHDDIYYPQKLQVDMDYILENNLQNKNVIIYSNINFIDENSKIIDTTNYQYLEPNKKNEYALLRGLVTGISLLIPKKAFIEYGGFPIEYKCIQDYYLFYKFMKTYKYIFIKDITAASRMHASQVTNTSPKVMEEGNFLWIMMQKELPDDIKIRLEGSKYKFYAEMYKYLRKYSKYEGAQQFAQLNMSKNLELQIKRIEKYLNTDEKLYKDIISIVKGVNKNSNECIVNKELKDVASQIGLENLLVYIIDNTVCEQYKKKYCKMLKRYQRIRIRKKYINIFKKVIKKCGTDGFWITVKYVNNYIKKGI